MIRYVALQFLQGLRARPLLFLLTVAGVALGVASVVTVQLLNQGAISAFRRGLDATSGGSDLIVRPRGPVLEADALAAGLSTPGVHAVHPVHRISTRVLGASEGQTRQLSVVGLDLMAGDGGLTGPDGDQAGVTPGAEESQSPTIFTNPSLLLSEGAAESLASFLGRSLVAGDTLSLAHGSLVHGVTVARIIPGNASTAVMDLAWSQHLFGEGLTQLNVDLTSSGAEPVRAVAASLERRLGQGVRITTPDEEGLEGESLLSAFRLNLTALSLISVFVGAFLVYGTTRASLVRRRGEFGVLRSLGASRGQLLGVVSADVALLGLTGILVGLPAGYLAARANLDAVSGTITNLYLLEAIQSVPLPPWIVALAVAIGLAAAALGGALPAVETVGARIRTLLSGRQRPSLTGPDHRTLAKGALAAAAAGLLLWASPWAHRGMAMAFFFIVAVPLAAPAFVEAVARPMHPQRLGLAYAVSSLSHRLASAGVAVAGLAVAIAMMVGITIMVTSFRESLAGWIERTVRADVYVSAAAWRGDRDAPGLDPAVLGRMQTLEGVSAMDQIRGFRGRAEDRPVALRGVRMDLLDTETRFQVLQGPVRVEGEEGVFVSEPFARKAGVGAGDRLSLETPGGIVRPTITAVVRDYGNEAGAITMDLSQMARWYGPGDPHGVALYLERGVDPGDVLERVSQATTAYGLTIQENRELRENALQVFDQTFRITVVLQGMALVIAAVGVTLTLLVLGTDEAGLLALYRALGATGGQVFRFFVAKGIAIALLGTVLGVAGGLALAAVLVHVVNPSYFGWSLEFHLPGGTLLRQAAWVLVAAAAAALVPALGASRPRRNALNPVEA